MGSGKIRVGRTTLLAGALLLLGACATTETKVSCEGRLQPINAPSPAKVDALAKTSDRVSQGVSP
jgi:hypothetical protein